VGMSTRVEGLSACSVDGVDSLSRLGSGSEVMGSLHPARMPSVIRRERAIPARRTRCDGSGRSWGDTGCPFSGNRGVGGLAFTARDPRKLPKLVP
jgi:hypothetical protein